MALSLSPLQRYHEGKYSFLSEIVAGDEHGVTILNPKASVRVSSGNVRFRHLQRNQRPCTTSSGKVIMSFFTTGTYCLSRFWNGESPSMSSVIKPHCRTLDEPSS
ncbi:hypothetical protein TNCV_849411 [Trichonephila clavipes]|uniref:Uncharacterized protein n=1 Tax=Trichonephila clavipes TaxID=2585209 RepID=A0A8X6RHG0_TRICX|nr:hypothetical protein TNCV_849411 [Trichonephila clavipes]